MLKRHRTKLAIALGLTVAVGLASRLLPTPLPRGVQLAIGNVLWATAAYWLIAILRPTWPRHWVAAIALGLAFASELLQLSQAGWLQSLRQIRPIGAFIGSQFTWMDMAMYVAGVILAVLIDRLIRKHSTPSGVKQR